MAHLLYNLNETFVRVPPEHRIIPSKQNETDELAIVRQFLWPMKRQAAMRDAALLCGELCRQRA